MEIKKCTSWISGNKERFAYAFSWETRESFRKLNEKVKREIQGREDIEVLLVNYNEVLEHPKSYIDRICRFIEESDMDTQRMVGAIDKRLYRQRRTT